jgi:sulfite exporter TauE/SafE
MTQIKQSHLSHVQRLTKYMLMGLIVGIATRYIPDNIMQTKEIIMIGATSSIAFAILDMISPAISIQQVKSEEKQVSHKALVEA